VRVTIDAKVCQGHGMCVATAPVVFVMDEREHGSVGLGADDVPADQEAAVRRAVLLCPEEAIQIEQ